MTAIQPSLNFQDNPSATQATGIHCPYEHTENWDRDRETRDRELGKVSTPKEIAAIMADWVTHDQPDSVLDPAAGLGNLLLECKRRLPKIKLIGVEKDTETLDQALKTAPAGTELIAGDYLQMRFQGQRAIIANPPYVKAHFLNYSKEQWRLFQEAFGVRLDGLTNLYALFLLKIYEDLASGGRAAVIVPAEFLNANFGRPIKEHFLERLRPSAIIVFDPNISVFDSALTTSCIILIEKGSQGPIRLKSVETVRELQSFFSNFSGQETGDWIDAAGLSPDEKWLNLLFSPLSRETARLLRCRVGDYFKCRRGIATGSNEYFCLSQSEIKSLGMRVSDFDRCITKANHSDAPIFSDADFEKLIAQDKKCFLLNPQEKSSPMEAYLAKGQAEGIHQRHLPIHRPVWYLPENRKVAAIWAAVFSREKAKFILNAAKVKNLTCFHGLYSLNDSWQEAVIMTVFLNTSLALESYSAINRFYGGGLKKVEPKDVEAMPCPALPKISDNEARELLKLLNSLSGQSETIMTNRLDEISRELFA